jgi:predicted dehydrogenase
MERFDHLAESRRSFLTKTAALAGATVFFGSQTYAARRLPVPLAGPRAPLGPDQAIRIGIIGTGGMGRGHCEAFANINSKATEKVEVVAIADCWPRNLNAAADLLAKHQPNVKLDKYADYRELLSREDIHGVLIASPEHWHHQHAIDAIKAGKDVYLEKPMTLDLANALALREVVLANPSIMFQVGTQMMRLPKYHEAKKVIAEGLIGTPTISQTSYCRNSKDGEWNYYHVDPNWKEGVEVDWNAWLGPAGKHPFDPYVLNRWRRYRKFSTGIIGDLLVHVMTPLVMALDQGWPKRVVATGSHLIDKKMENHDTLNLLVEFETGHQMIVAGATTNEVGLETMIRGNKGSLFLGGRHVDFKPESLYAEELEPRKIECADIGNDQDVHRLGWLQSIRSREAPPSGIDLGTKVMVIVDLATRSMWEGKAFTFDSKSMTAKAV